MAGYTFVTQRAQSGQSRPHRSRRACSDCRRKKRRCNHYRDSTNGDTSFIGNLVWKEPQTTSRSGTVPDTEVHPSPRGRINEQSDPEDQGIQAEELQPEPSHQNVSTPIQREVSNDLPPRSSPARFVGDLNPEARLLDKTTTPEDVQGMETGDVGVWLQPRQRATNATPGQRVPSARSFPSSHRQLGQCPSPISSILSQDTIATLSKIYFEKMHRIMPLLNEEEYWETMKRATIPPPLVHVVCLLAAKDCDAENKLFLLQSRSVLVSVREFCTQLHVSITSALSRRTSLPKLILIRILGLLSLHQEGSDGMEESSSSIAQAMHYAQSMALHLPRPNDANSELKRIFWCLWVLDRLNSATNSRPCIMGDIDIGIDELTPAQSGSVAFDVCFQIAKCLNRIIALYRPMAKEPDTGSDFDFPAFEKIIEDAAAWQLSPSTAATLHIFYLATAILSYRLKTISTLPSLTPARVRQQLSSMQVIRYLQDRDRLNSLHPFPIAVYATSLALSISYQQLRYSRIPSDQEIARQDFNAACDILQELRLKWASADAMASLAYRIAHALGQVSSLDMVRIHHSDPLQNDGLESHGDYERTQDETSGFPEEIDSNLPIDDHTMGQTTDFQEDQNYQETMDLFSGMDDISWMYLDAENPISFDSIPWVAMEEM